MKKRKTRRNPNESDLIELTRLNREQSKSNLLKMLKLVENELGASNLLVEFGVVSLLRRQYDRGDIDRETLFHWLRVEGLLK